jgi:phosphoglycerate dehydrogenase-like enzyme
VNECILLWAPMDRDYLPPRVAAFPDVTMPIVGGLGDLPRLLPDADAMVMLGHFYTAQSAPVIKEYGKKLRWIQLTTAGYDSVITHGAPPGVVVTNAGHSHGPMVAEHALMLLLALIRRLPAYAKRQVAHEFDRTIPLPLTTLEEATVAVIGLGGIGRETARRAKAFGAHVLGVSRSGRPEPLVDEVFPATGLHEALARADAVVIAAALTEETHGLIDEAAIAAMKPSAVLVNIARGAIVQTAPLMAALQSGHLSGAGLDVTDPEPPPADHPLWDCPNVIITPHVSGIGSVPVRRRIGDVVMENLRRLRAGETLVHVVAG